MGGPSQPSQYCSREPSSSNRAPSKQITWRVPRNRASNSPRRGTQSQIVWIVLTFLRLNVNPSSNLISLEIGNIHPNVKSSSIVRTAVMIRKPYNFWASKKTFSEENPARLTPSIWRIWSPNLGETTSPNWGGTKPNIFGIILPNQTLVGPQQSFADSKISQNAYIHAYIKSIDVEKVNSALIHVDG